MDSLILPFRRRRGKDEKRQAIKDGVGNELALKHKAQSRIRAADLEFERAFAEVMGLAKKEKKAPEKRFEEPKSVVVVGKKAKKEKSKKEEIRSLLKKEKLEQQRKEVKPKERPSTKKPNKTKQKKKTKKKKKRKPKEEKTVKPLPEKKQEVVPAKENRRHPKSKKQKKEPTKEVIPKPPAKEKSASKTEGWATFNFWYSDKKASSLQEFKQAISAISEQSLEHHAEHNDFSKYLGEFYDKGVATRVEAFEKTLKGSKLRERILGEL